MANYPSSDPTNDSLHTAVNNLSTALDGAIDGAVVTLTVLDTTGFPTVGAVTIDAERISYTGKTGTTFTGCTRGFGGTNNVSHIDASDVKNTYGAEYHEDIKAEVIASLVDLRDCFKEELTDSTAPATAATDMRDRVDQLVTQLKNLSGEVDWKTAPATTLAVVDSVKAALDEGDTPASTASDIKDRLDQIVSQLKLITGGANWFTAPVDTIANLDSTKAEDSAVVHDTGDESIAGIKTFTTQLIGKGTITNDDAAAGYIGEHMAASSATPANFPATGSWGDANSLALTAGDWDVTLQITALSNGATWTAAFGGISPNSGNNGTGLTGSDNMFVGAWASSATTPEQVLITIANYRLSLSGSTTYYAKVRSTYTVGQSQYTYRFSARRIR